MLLGLDAMKEELDLNQSYYYNGPKCLEPSKTKTDPEREQEKTTIRRDPLRTLGFNKQPMEVSIASVQLLRRP